MGMEVGIQFSRPLRLWMAAMMVSFPTRFASLGDLRYWILISAAVEVLSKDNPRDADSVLFGTAGEQKTFVVKAG